MELALPDKLFSSTEVCDILGVSLRTLYRYIEAGDIESIQMPTGRHRFTKKHMEDFLSKGKKRVVAKKGGEVEEPVQPERSAELTKASEPLETPEASEADVEELPKEEKEGGREVEEEKVGSEFASPEGDQLGGLSLAEEGGKEEEKAPVLGQEELVEDVTEVYYKAGDLDVRALAKGIKDAAERQNLKYAFTGLGGLSLHYPIKPFSNLEVYVDKDLLDLWVRELNLVEASKLTANLKVRFDNDALSSAKSLGGLMVVSAEVLERDLRRDGYDELAEELKAKNL